MKKALSFALVALSAVAISAQASTPASTNIGASVRIARGTTVTPFPGPDGQLRFGDVISANVQQTVDVNPNTGTRTCSPIQSNCINPASAGRALVKVSGEVGTAVSVSTSNGTLSGPGQTMNFTTRPSLANGNLNAAGELDVAIGGTLTVNPNQATGFYTGEFTVTVNNS